jgi:septal ring factor EnvC (AmiA/AmiB activator)
MKRCLSILLFAFLSCVALLAQSNKVTTIRQQKQAAQKEIKETSRKLQQNTAKTNQSLNQLNTIAAEIEMQQRTITTLSGQMVGINQQLGFLGDSIRATQRRLAVLRSSYAKAVRSVQAHSTPFDRLLFLFSANSFHEAYRRMLYMRQFSKWREKQVNEIKAIQARLGVQYAQVRNLQSQKVGNLNKQNTAQLTLLQKKKEQAQTVADLKRQGSQLQVILAEKKRKAQALDNELDRLIAEEERKAAERARAEEQRRQAEERQRLEAQQKLAEQQRAEAQRQAELERQRQQQLAQQQALQQQRQQRQQQQLQTNKQQASRAKTRTKPNVVVAPPKVNVAPPVIAKAPTPPPPPSHPSGGYQMDNAERNLSGNFESNKGRLLFPVGGSNCRIVRHFGRQRHPELSHVEMNNGGIDIETSPGAVARAVFYGKVSAVFRQDGFNTVVMVRHGNYLTIYVNLSEIFVHTGEIVKANQVIGKIFSDPEDGNRTILHFEVRKERAKLNPEEWVR